MSGFRVQGKDKRQINAHMTQTCISCPPPLALRPANQPDTTVTCNIGSSVLSSKTAEGQKWDNAIHHSNPNRVYYDNCGPL